MIKNILKRMFLSVMVLFAMPMAYANTAREGIIFFDKVSFLVNKSYFLKSLWTGKYYDLNAGQRAVIEILKTNGYQIGVFNPVVGIPLWTDIDAYLPHLNEQFSQYGQQPIFSVKSSDYYNRDTCKDESEKLFNYLTHKAQGRPIYFVSNNIEKLAKAQNSGLVAVYAQNNEPRTIINALNEQNAGISYLNYIMLNPHKVLAK